MKHFLNCPSKYLQASACLWCAGLGSGFLVVSFADISFSWMRSALCAPMSIVGLLCGSLLPFLLSYLCFLFSIKQLLPAISFFRAMRYGVCAGCIFSCCSTAGWLFFLLLMLPDAIQLPVLWWFWLRHFMFDHRQQLHKDFLLCIMAILTSLLIQEGWIAPFLAKILTI